MSILNHPLLIGYEYPGLLVWVLIVVALIFISKWAGDNGMYD